MTEYATITVPTDYLTVPASSQKKKNLLASIDVEFGFTSN